MQFHVLWKDTLARLRDLIGTGQATRKLYSSKVFFPRFVGIAVARNHFLKCQPSWNSRLAVIGVIPRNSLLLTWKLGCGTFVSNFQAGK